MTRGPACSWSPCHLCGSLEAAVLGLHVLARSDSPFPCLRLFNFSVLLCFRPSLQSSCSPLFLSECAHLWRSLRQCQLVCSKFIDAWVIDLQKMLIMVQPRIPSECSYSPCSCSGILRDVVFFVAAQFSHDIFALSSIGQQHQGLDGYLSLFQWCYHVNWSFLVVWFFGCCLQLWYEQTEGHLLLPCLLYVQI